MQTLSSNLDQNALANSADPDQTALQEQSDLGLYYLQILIRSFKLDVSESYVSFAHIMHHLQIMHAVH